MAEQRKMVILFSNTEQASRVAPEEHAAAMPAKRPAELADGFASAARENGP